MKSVALTIFELLALNAPKFMGSCDPDTPYFKFFPGHFRAIPRGMCTNLNLIALAFLELLALDAKKFKVLCDPGHAASSKNFSGVMSRLSLRHACQILSL